MSRLICGDTLMALKRIPDGFVHVGVTSPPYNKQEKNKGWLVKNVVYDEYQDVMPESDYQANQVAVLDEIFRATTPTGSFFYNHKLRWDRGELYHPMDWLRKTKWAIRQEIIWHRVLAGNIRGWRFWQVEERIYWLYKPSDGNLIGPELKSQDAKCTSVWKGVPENSNPHPAPFPLWLPTRAILSALNAMEIEKGMVLDPYIGSGTTAVAAKLLGHDYIGIDCSKEYIAYARERLKNAHTEKRKLREELDLHRISDSFRKRKQEGKHVGKYKEPQGPVPMIFSDDKNRNLRNETDPEQISLL